MVMTKDGGPVGRIKTRPILTGAYPSLSTHSCPFGHRSGLLHRSIRRESPEEARDEPPPGVAPARVGVHRHQHEVTQSRSAY